MLTLEEQLAARRSQSSRRAPQLAVTDGSGDQRRAQMTEAAASVEPTAAEPAESDNTLKSPQETIEALKVELARKDYALATQAQTIAVHTRQLNTQAQQIQELTERAAGGGVWNAVANATEALKPVNVSMLSARARAALGTTRLGGGLRSGRRVHASAEGQAPHHLQLQIKTEEGDVDE